MCKVVDETHDIAAAFKVNTRLWWKGDYSWYAEMHAVICHALRHAPEVPIILDGKYTDVRHTNERSAEEAFDFLGVDAVTVVANPHAGRRQMEPFLSRADKGVFVVCLNSDETGKPMDDLFVSRRGVQIPYYQWIAERVATEWNTNGNCGVVMGATYPKKIRLIRTIVGDMPILVPGIGAQGGDGSLVVKNGSNRKGRGLLIASSRFIAEAQSPRKAALFIHNLTKKKEGAEK
jgi:orotidine-5'-phosphate decarboxylase